MLATDTSVYLFILEACLCPFGRPVKFETKRENPFFFEACWTVCKTVLSMDICTACVQQTHKNIHTHAEGSTQTHSFLSSFFFCTALPFSPGRFRVPQMCHQTLVSIWTWGEKEILDRKVYKKRTLWIFDIFCTAASKWGRWRGTEKQLQDMFLFIYCLFSLPSFREMEASTRPQLTHPCIEGLSGGPWKKNRRG